MDHHRFLMIQGLWLWAAFRAVGVSWGDHLWCSSNYWTSQRRERERTPFPAFVPSCCCWAFQLRRMQSLEHLGHMFGHRGLEWLHGSLWSRSTPHSACWNHGREPVSTEIGLILFPVCVKQSLLIKKTGISFCLKQVSQHGLLSQFQLWLLRKSLFIFRRLRNIIYANLFFFWILFYRYLPEIFGCSICYYRYIVKFWQLSYCSKPEVPYSDLFFTVALLPSCQSIN